jgi:glycosyltransferase involved in cell wall biosynthesis
VLEARHGPSLTPNRAVVATCVDLDAFVERPAPPVGSVIRLMLSGSLNRYYDVPTMLRLHARLQELRPATLTVVAPGATEWDEAFGDVGAERITARPRDMPAVVARATAGLSICRSDVGDSLAAAVPTKIAEFLATGRPVIVNRGLGDMDAIVAQHRCGVVLDGTSAAAVDAAVTAIQELVDDPELGHRCRQAALDHFSLGAGVERLLSLYEAVMGASDLR